MLSYLDLMASENIRLITFNEKYVASFVELNREWIQKYFALEEADQQQLLYPEKNILKKGGEIFFVLENDKVIATCAMVPHGSGYELAKMAVSPQVRGQGFGDFLMQGVIDWARQKGASEVMLLSNTKLEPAINLYRKHGFEVIQLGPHPDYERCNIEMRLKL